MWWRRWLHSRRETGTYQSGILVIGHRDKAAGLIGELHKNSRVGFTVLGVCVPTGEIIDGELIGGVPVLGGMDRAAEIAERIGASAVAVTGADAITSETVRQLGWDLEGKGIDLALTLSLVDVAGPRVLMRPVNGLPMMYVDEARFTGGKYILKSLFDWVMAAMITVLLLPVLAVVALLVRATSLGPCSTGRSASVRMVGASGSSSSGPWSWARTSGLPRCWPSKVPTRLGCSTSRRTIPE